MKLSQWLPNDFYATGERRAPWDLGLRRETSTRRWTPNADVYEQDNTVVVQMDVPGLEKDQLNISVEDGRLTISGHRGLNEFDEEAEVKGDETVTVTDESDNTRAYRRRERPSGQFKREYVLPDTMDEDSIQADLSNGVLRIEMSRAEEAAPRQIDIEIN
jgi:HSP20 family protein